MNSIPGLLAEAGDLLEQDRDLALAGELLARLVELAAELGDHALVLLVLRLDRLQDLHLAR